MQSPVAGHCRGEHLIGGDFHGFAGADQDCGLAGRRLILRVVARDRSGAVIAEEARTYARILGDDAAVEVPFDVATRVLEDTRLRPGERRRERVRLPAEAAEVEATIVDRALDPAVAAALGLPPPSERAWASLRLAAPSRHR